MTALGDQIRFGVYSGPQHATFEDCLELWRRCEELGYDWLSVFDHFMPIVGDPDGPCFEGPTMMAAMAAHTTRVRVAILVTGVTYRHPAVAANIAATIDHISGGRAEYGVGAAWLEKEHRQYGIAFPRLGERMDMLDEACRVLRGLWTEERFSFDGEHYQLQDAQLDPKPLQARLPLMIGGDGERRTLRIVAEHADVWNTGLHEIETFRHKLGVLSRHCEDVGRDPAEIRKSLTFRAILAEDEAALTARRRELAPTLPIDESSFIFVTPEQCVERLRHHHYHRSHVRRCRRWRRRHDRGQRPGRERDRRRGGQRHVTVVGAHDLVIRGRDGDDTINGGSRADEISGGLGLDTLRGGAGSDTITAGDDFPDDAPPIAKLAVSLDDVANDGAQAPAGLQTANWHSDIEAVMTGGNDDSIVGNDAPNILIGGLGTDTITGGGGADVIYGGVHPLLFKVDEEDGGDTINSRDGDPDIVSCSGGTDSVVGDSIDGLELCETTDLAAPPGQAPIIQPVAQPPLPAAAVDRTPPVTRTGSAASRTFKGLKKADLASSRGVSYPVTTDEPATITCEALATASGARISKVGDVVIGEGKLARGTGARSCRIRIGARYRKQVRRLKRLRVRVVATDAAGNRRESTATVRVLK